MKKLYVVELYMSAEDDPGTKTGWAQVGRPLPKLEAEKEKALYERACSGPVRLIEYTAQTEKP